MNEWEAQLQQRRRRRMFGLVFYVLHFLDALRSTKFYIFWSLILRILYTLEFSIPINPLRDLVHKRVHS